MDSSELKNSLNDLKIRLDDIKDGVFDVTSKEKRLKEIESELSKEEVWSDLGQDHPHRKGCRPIPNCSPRHQIFGASCRRLRIQPLCQVQRLCRTRSKREGQADYLG